MPLYSDEIQDIMGVIPGRILRIGLSVIFGTILLLLVGSYFFKYPETVPCPVVLTTINPPQELYARSTGLISKLNIQEGDTVKNGDIIAILENTANYEDIKQLGLFLINLQGIIIWDSTLIYTQKLPVNLSLGELQSSYLQLFKVWNSFKLYLEQGYLPLKIKLQNEKICRNKDFYEKLQYREQLQLNSFKLAEKQFRRDSAFYYRVKDGMSLSDYEKKTQTYLEYKSSFLSFSASVSETENEIILQKEELINLKIQYNKELYTYYQELDEAYRLLYEQYNQWKNKYVLESNIDGVITLSNFWSHNQTVNIGDRVATVVPFEQTRIIGRAFIDMIGIGKVEKGQRVNIKLNSFPHIEFGFLKGTISKISLVPERGKGYVAEIDLDYGMLSSYNKDIKFIQEIEGIADIVTKNKRLLEHLINPIKSKIKT